MNIIIDNYNLTIMVTDNEESLNKCITLTSESESNVFCANENNLININLLKGKYIITYNEDDLYKEKSITINLDKDNLINLNLERKNVIEENKTIKEEDNLIKDDTKLDNNINEEYTDNIIFENTLSINNIIYIIIFLIIISTGVIFVKKKK